MTHMVAKPEPAPPPREFNSTKRQIGLDLSVCAIRYGNLPLKTPSLDLRNRKTRTPHGELRRVRTRTPFYFRHATAISKPLIPDSPQFSG